jgi:hypothetical protein
MVLGALALGSKCARTKVYFSQSAKSAKSLKTNFDDSMWRNPQRFYRLVGQGRGTLNPKTPVRIWVKPH